MSTLKTNWVFDFDEEWEDANGSVFRYSWSTKDELDVTDPNPLMPGGDYLGAIKAPQDEEFSVQYWVDQINQIFQRATLWTASSGKGTRATYAITPSVHFHDTTQAQGTSDFVLRYLINFSSYAAGYGPSGGSSVWKRLIRFRVAFKDGRHGYNTPVHLFEGPVPRGHAGFRNYSDTRALVLPYQTRSVVVTDRPPVPPHIEITPFMGVSNKLLLVLNSNTGEFLARPVVIKASDAEYIAAEYESQGNDYIASSEVVEAIADPQSPLRLQYTNDDPVSDYEIFRLTTRPTSYQDFDTADNPHQVISGRISPKKSSTMATLIDDIEPNTKYYYCARALDVHNNFSNPTSVFEVEMVDNEGQVYLILKPILFGAATGAVPSKTGRKFLYIEPSLRNLSIPTMPASGSAESDNPGSIYGAEDGGGSCWTKTFKLRVTSKKSNKKIDLNITFKNTGVINP